MPFFSPLVALGPFSSVDGWFDGWFDGWVDGSSLGWVDGSSLGWVVVPLDGWIERSSFPPPSTIASTTPMIATSANPPTANRISWLLLLRFGRANGGAPPKPGPAGPPQPGPCGW